MFKKLTSIAIIALLALVFICPVTTFGQTYDEVQAGYADQRHNFYAMRAFHIYGKVDGATDPFRITSETDETDETLARFNYLGYLGVGVDPLYPGDFNGAIRIGDLAGDGADGVIKYDGSNFRGWTDGAWGNFILYADLVEYATDIFQGLGTAAFSNKEIVLTDGTNLPTGSAVKAFVEGKGYITDPNDSVSGGELDGVFSTTGILKRTGAGAYSTISDNSTNWNAAYSDRLKWDGGATGLNASTGRTSLGLGTAATANTEYPLTDGTNLPTGAAVKTFVEGKGYTTASETIDYVTDVFASLGTAAYRTATDSLSSNEYLPDGNAIMNYLTSAAYVRDGLNYSGTGYYGLFQDKTGDNRLRFRSLKSTNGSIDFSSSTDSLDLSVDPIYFKKDGSVTATGSWNMGNHNITGINDLSADDVFGTNVYVGSGVLQTYSITSTGALGLTANSNIDLNSPVDVHTNNIYNVATLTASTVRANTGFNYNGTSGVSGSITTASGETLTFQGGILTSIAP